MFFSQATLSPVQVLLVQSLLQTCNIGSYLLPLKQCRANLSCCAGPQAAAIAGLVTSVLQKNPRHGGESRTTRWRAAGQPAVTVRHCQADTQGLANFANKSSGRSLLGLRRFNGPGVTDSPGAGGQRGPT